MNSIGAAHADWASWHGCEPPAARHWFTQTSPLESASVPGLPVACSSSAGQVRNSEGSSERFYSARGPNLKNTSHKHVAKGFQPVPGWLSRAKACLGCH